MNNTMRLGIAAVVVAAVVLLGFRFLIGPNTSGVGGSNPTPTASPTPSPSPTATPRPMPASGGALAAGTYVAGAPFSLRATFTVPEGWQGRIGGPYLVDLGPSNSQEGVFLSIFDLVSVDPCHSDKGFLVPSPGPSTADLVNALTNMPGIAVTNVSDVSVSGYSGTLLTMTAPDSFSGCTLSQSGYVIWQLPLGAMINMTPGEQDRVWILDVAGTRVVIDATDWPTSTDQQRAEAQAVFDSLQLAPAS